MKLTIICLSTIIILLATIASANACCISNLEIDTETQTFNLTISDLEIGESYEVYSIIEDNHYSFAFFATSTSEVISIQMDEDSGFYKVRKVLTLLGSSYFSG